MRKFMEAIRIAEKRDASALLGIYSPYISNTAVTFETEIPSLENFEQRIVTYQQDWPWLVYEADGRIVGYAYAGKHRERPAYQWCVESSVYVDDNFQQQGIAKALYDSLFAILKHQGYCNVYAGITLPNDKSVAFHKKFGFNWLADYKNIGYKLDRWHTVSWWQMQLNDYMEVPASPVKFPAVDKEFLEKILKKNNG
jgi:L-amino acid N-acyltransferase YncA